MALSDNNNLVMPVTPMYGGGYSNGGGFFGGDWAWILLLLLIGGNGWGFGGGFGGGMMPWMMGMGAGMGGFGLDYLYPWLNNSQHMSDGFRDQQLNTQISDARTDINRGFGDVQNALCSGFGGVNMNLANGFAGVNANLSNGFAGVNAGIANGFAQAEIAANARQIADMQQNFAAQTAVLQGFNGVQSQAADCCCKTQTGIQDLKYVVATENCADRTAAYQNTRDIIDSQTRGTQAILDKLCALELDGVKGQLAQAQRENVGLQNQLNMATMAASQAAQTATFQQGLNNEVDALYNRLKNCPVNTVPVYGNQPVFTCAGPNLGNMGCGCGAMA